MIICVAQCRPVVGEVDANIRKHTTQILEAVARGAALIVFPELSLTAYEPGLAATVATSAADARFSIFQNLSNTHGITIGAGMPLRQVGGVCIGMLLFQPNQPVKVNAKKYLHPDEEPYFISGPNASPIVIGDNRIALAICYELSVPAHAQEVLSRDVQLYVASVAKSAKGMGKAQERLAEIAATHAVPVLLSNSVGVQDGMECCGNSAVWNGKGECLAQLGSAEEGLLFFDTDLQEVLVVA